MLKISKGLAIGLTTTLAILSVAVFFLLKAPDAQAQAEAATPPTPPSSATDAISHPPAATPDLLAAPAASSIDVTVAMQDRVLGQESAPVTIIEYASLTCPHCAHFETEILPEVKKQLLDTGKAKLIYRDFPLDRFALEAAMVSRCISPLKYYDMLDVIFSKQEIWAKAKDPLAALEKLASLAGMDAADYKSCVENHALETAILTHVQEAQNKYKVQSTPTFVFNDGAEQFSGAQPVEKFAATIEKLTKGK